jgi:Tfp pilus assembly protein PilN
MQIRINLHPQRDRKRRLALPVGGATLKGVKLPFRDRYLLGAVGAVVTSSLAVAALHVTQQRTGAELEARESAAVRDSTHYAAVIAARTRAIARRDSLSRTLRVISEIDSTRYVWAHVLDEVSRALPPYTWLTSVQQTSAPPTPPGALPKPGEKPAKPAPNGKPAVDSAAGPVRFRVVGQTVDLQALTLFMRDLETSPFVRNVQLAHSEPVQSSVQGAGRDVTEFTLDAEVERAPHDALRTVSISVPVR